ncbi:MAG: hypothetical protein P8P49_00345 [Opitutales bacterium]|nr:hypothetical protein [Opitutales bacterium]
MVFADTSFPKTIIPFRGYDPLIKKLLGFEFKSEARFSEKRDGSFKFKHSFNKWLAQKYSFRTTNLIINEEYQCITIDWDLCDGVHLATQSMNPQTRELEEEDPRVLYLVFLYRKKGEYKNANALHKLKQFINYLEQMPNCPIEDVILRATGIEQHNWNHLKELDYIPNEKATSIRLRKIYDRILGCVEYRCKDQDGIPYRKVKFKIGLPALLGAELH